MMAQSRAKITWEISNYGKYINQLPPNIIKSIRHYERINKKICRQKISIMFNEICINEEMLPIYIYIHGRKVKRETIWRRKILGYILPLSLMLSSDNDGYLYHVEMNLKIFHLWVKFWNFITNSFPNFLGWKD